MFASGADFGIDPKAVRNTRGRPGLDSGRPGGLSEGVTEDFEGGPTNVDRSVPKKATLPRQSRNLGNGRTGTGIGSRSVRSNFGGQDGVLHILGTCKLLPNKH